MPTVQLAPPLDWLRRFNAELDGTSERLERLRGQVDTVAASSQAAAADHASSMQRIEQSTAQTAATVSSALDMARASADSASSAIATAGNTIRSHAGEAQAAVEQMHAATAAAVGEQATALDDLIQKLFAVKTPYQETLLSMIEAAKAGILTIDEIVKQFGDRIVVIDGQERTLSEVFRRIDWREWEREFQALIDRVRDGSAALSEVEAKLAESQNAVARRLLQMIQLFRQGKVTLDALAAVVADIQRVFPDSELDELAQALLQGLRDGTL